MFSRKLPPALILPWRGSWPDLPPSRATVKCSCGAWPFSLTPSLYLGQPGKCSLFSLSPLPSPVSVVFDEAGRAGTAFLVGWGCTWWDGGTLVLLAGLCGEAVALLEPLCPLSLGLLFTS